MKMGSIGSDNVEMRPAKNFRKEHIYTSIYMQGSIFFPNPASYEFVTDIWYRQYFISLFYECIYTYIRMHH